MKTLLHPLLLTSCAFLLCLAPARADALGETAPALFNQANAEQRASHLGPAILHYERAQILAPHDAAIAQNLRAAREKAGVSAPAVAAWQRPVQALSLDALAILVSICLLLLCLLLFGTRFLATTLRGMASTLAGVLGAVALLALGAIGLRWPELSRAVILPAQATARVAPAASAGAVFEPKGGDLVALRGAYGDYVRVRTADGRAGWINKTEIEPIVPTAVHLSAR